MEDVKEKLIVLQTYYEPSIVAVRRKVQIKPLEWKKINLANVAEEFSLNKCPGQSLIVWKEVPMVPTPQYAYQARSN